MPRPLDIRTTLAYEINARGYTLMDVSRATSISYMHLKHAAAGRRALSMTNLNAISRYIGVPTWRLYTTKEPAHADR